ncbi:hypothetical protein Tco_0873987 [Tanacetum coccineum]|uniref:Uncharacterized protein n=1 Tax=Tanacetum coccineum TaxID=301880 RepID=A0ABQ5BKQ9_9ASTR
MRNRPQLNDEDGTEAPAQEEVVPPGPSVEIPPTTEVVIEPEPGEGGLVLRKDHQSVRSEDHAHQDKSAGGIGVGEGSTAPILEDADAPTGSKSVSNQDPLSYSKPEPFPEQDIAQSSRGAVSAPDPESEKSSSFELRHLPNDEFLNQYNINLARQVAMGSQLRLRFEQEARLLRKAKARVSKRDQQIQARKV